MMKTGRRSSRAESAMRRGSVPPPARMPSVPLSVPIRGGRLAQTAARFGTDELDDLVDIAVRGENSRHFLKPFGKRAVGTEEHPVGASKRLYVVALEAAALQPHQIEAGQPRAITHGLRIGNDIALDAGHAAHEGMHADAAELVNRGISADEGVVGKRDVSG